MAPTVPAPASAPPPAITLDELVARGLTAGELSVIAAYSAFCGGSLLLWTVKLRRAS